MKTYEQFLESKHKTAWLQKEDFYAIQNDALDAAANKCADFIRGIDCGNCDSCVAHKNDIKAILSLKSVDNG